MLITNPTYDILKKLVQVILPAFASLYFGLSSIWGLPAGEQVVGTVALITTFLGVSIGISSKNYRDSERAYDGAMVVSTTPEGGKNFLLELEGDPAELENREVITFKVKPDKPGKES